MHTIFSKALITGSILFCFWSAPNARADEPMPSPKQESGYADPQKIPYSTLTQDEKDILDRGEISSDTQLVSGLVGTFIGFGLGQAVQGRYWPTGFLITAGEAASIGVIFAGVANCTNNLTLFDTASSGLCDNNHGLLIGGLVGLLAFRVWEILDVWIAPSLVNRRYWNLHDRVQETAGPHLIALPISDIKTGAISGGRLALQYNF